MDPEWNIQILSCMCSWGTTIRLFTIASICKPIYCGITQLHLIHWSIEILVLSIFQEIQTECIVHCTVIHTVQCQYRIKLVESWDSQSLCALLSRCDHFEKPFYTWLLSIFLPLILVMQYFHWLFDKCFKYLSTGSWFQWLGCSSIGQQNYNNFEMIWKYQNILWYRKYPGLNSFEKFPNSWGSSEAHWPGYSPGIPSIQPRIF